MGFHYVSALLWRRKIYAEPAAPPDRDACCRFAALTQRRAIPAHTRTGSGPDSPGREASEAQDVTLPGRLVAHRNACASREIGTWAPAR
jgi:hypothetical protein